MIIDLRSDTVTKPSAGMLEAMWAAEVGDDVFGEDPTALILEKKAAEMFNMEAAVFCPSGTMTNQIAIKTHTQPGDELICDVHSHIINYEGGGVAFNSGVQPKPIMGTNGKISAAQIEQGINGDFDWLSRTSLVCLENTVNKAGGSLYRLNEVRPIRELCNEKKLKLHLDGARLFNALVETNESTKDWGASFDSISICLSKGLGTPLGSLLLGKRDFIKQARRYRKVFGGGMRQIGYMAAAGIYALENNIARLKEDNNRAKQLGKIVGAHASVESVLPVETNVLVFNLKNTTAEEMSKKLSDKGIRVSIFGRHTLRMVTHLDFTDDMLEQTEQIFKTI